MARHTVSFALLAFRQGASARSYVHMEDQMSTHSISRRASLATGGGLLIMRPEHAFGYPANSAVTFGIIGTGGRGRYVGTEMVKDGRTQLVALCDIYPDRLDAAKTQIPNSDRARTYKSHEELLAHPGLDAVLIATPVYLHPVHFEAAVKAKKHIYCEKPAGADVAGVKRLLRAGLKADRNRTIQFGFQQRFSNEYLYGERLVKDGKLGKVTHLESYWILGNPPATGFRSPYPEAEQKVRHWGMWMETSGGAIVEQDCHGIDVLNWFGGGPPAKAYGIAGLRYPVPYGDWNSDHHNITYTYPNGTTGWLISVKHTAAFRDVKERVYGSQGMVELARMYVKWHGPQGDYRYKSADNLSDRSLIEMRESRYDITIDAVKQFFTSVIESRPINMTQVAADATFSALLGRMAYEQKREVTMAELMKST